MAEGVNFPQANFVLTPPRPEDVDVYSLYVHRYQDLDGQGHVISCWRLTPEELAKVAETGVVWFHCWGQTHPPICIEARNPFEEKPGG